MRPPGVPKSASTVAADVPSGIAERRAQHRADNGAYQRRNRHDLKHSAASVQQCNDATRHGARVRHGRRARPMSLTPEVLPCLSDSCRIAGYEEIADRSQFSKAVAACKPML